MLKRITSFLITLGSILLPFVLCISLIFATVYFSVYSPEEFTKGVSEKIDEHMLDEQIKKLLKTTAETYGFDSEVLLSTLDKEDLKLKAGEYFTEYYLSFLSGNPQAPTLTYSNDSMSNTIKESSHLSERPEVFALEENITFFISKCINTVEASLNSLSANSIYSLLLSGRNSYLKIVNCGKYFIPLSVIFTALSVVLTFFIISHKRYKTAYITTLSVFGITTLFSIPMTFMNLMNLHMNLNINIGPAITYVDAVYSYTFSRLSVIYLSVSFIALVLFIASVVWMQSEKQST